jgi:hypothetical protein
MYHTTQNEVCDGRFPVNAQIWFGLIVAEITFVVCCVVDIVLTQHVMHHFCRSLHGKQCTPAHILARDQKSSSLQGFT